MMEATTVGNDVELMCKTLQFEHKLFYFDLKENPRGGYLKISEKTSATRSTIIVPVDGILWFINLFNYYASTDEREAFSKELKLDAKVEVPRFIVQYDPFWAARCSARLDWATRCSALA
ncbi:Transcription factor Pur-alpha 1 [Platanthera guangdongensis]|uniref:Transcription factor Pur-alpha 1 n=1 Tax=Platanthera guangdongensis TaxID=2320717 RepID=A0ABR2MDH6_9ASPA